MKVRMKTGILGLSTEERVRANPRSRLLAAAAAVTLLASSADAQLSIQKVKLTGETAPGPLGSTFEYILVPQSVPPPPPGTADGAFALFTASTRNAAGDLADYGVFAGLTTQLQPLFLANSAAPGTDGAVFAVDRIENTTDSVVVNDAGVTAMFGFLTGGDTTPGENDIGIWAGKPGNLQLLARTGRLVPSHDGDERFVNLDPPGLGNRRQVVFRGGTNLNVRIYAGSSPSNLRRIASNGDPAPIAIPSNDPPLTLLIRGFRPHGYTTKINASGQVAFGAVISESGRDDRDGIFFSSSEGLQTLAHTAQNRFSFNAPLYPGSEAPGTGNRGHFTKTGTFEINDAGQVAFESEFLSDDAIGNGIWIGTPGNRSLIARSGQDNLIDGGTLQEISVAPSGGFLNYSGEVVFLNSSTTIVAESVYRGRAGSITPIAWVGKPAEEAGPGWTFQSFSDATINDRGEIAFAAVLQNGSDSAPSLWLVNRRNELHLVARRGALFQVAPGDERTVDAMLPSRIDDEGQLVFCLAFQDENVDREPGEDFFFYSSGVFIAGVGPVYENLDTDLDGLPDRWEIEGLTVDGVFIDLPAMGADPRHKDLFIHADWMGADPARPGAVFKPNPRAIKMVVDAFARAPLGNPDGTQGIDLHVDLGPDSPLDFNGSTTWGALSRAGEVPYEEATGTFAGGYQWNAVDAIKAQRFTAAKRNRAFHYALFANTYGGSGSSGLSRGLPGNDFLVTMGTWNTPGGTMLQQAGTFMHEFGHNLGLHHGGADDINYKPNYLSIMSYAFQFTGLLSADGLQRTFDYSRRKLLTLDETKLLETIGIGEPLSRTVWSFRTLADSPAGTNQCIARPDDYFARFLPDPALDWSCDGNKDASLLAADVNGDGICVGIGNNFLLDTAPSGDDVVIARRVTAGPDRTCNTPAAGDDTQERPVGFKQPDTLEGFNDWPAVQFKGDGTIGAEGATPPEVMSTAADEPTEQEMLDRVPPALLAAELVAPLDLVSASTDRGSAPLDVTFNGGASTAKEGSIVDWQWDFGDGATGSGPTATHTYTLPGEYFASLTVTDSGGRKNLVPLLKRITVTDETPAGRALNISTRMRVETGDNVLIAGFIITGDQPRRVMIRGMGPSLPVNGALADPVLDLDSGTIVNDDWRSDQEAEIIATTIPPSSDQEAAIVATLAPGAHTAILSGSGGGTGVGLVEVYDLDSATSGRLANISSRGLVQTGDDVMIGGFIVGGSNPAQMLLRAIGPSLPVAGALQDPTLELVDSNGNSISNDNWRDTQAADITATTIPPAHDNEAAVLASLAPGAYTAVVRGKDGAIGVALVEAYHLQ